VLRASRVYVIDRFGLRKT